MIHGDAPHPDTVSTRCYNILLVEDHDDTRQCVHRLLATNGHHVTAARSCAEARQLANGTHFDLLLADVGLADGDGRELLAALQPARGIVMTGYASDGAESDSARAGFAAHLTKPMSFQTLEQAIAQAMSV